MNNQESDNEMEVDDNINNNNNNNDEDVINNLSQDFEYNANIEDNNEESQDFSYLSIHNEIINKAIDFVYKETNIKLSDMFIKYLMHHNIVKIQDFEVQNKSLIKIVFKEIPKYPIEKIVNPDYNKLLFSQKNNNSDTMVKIFITDNYSLLEATNAHDIGNPVNKEKENTDFKNVEFYNNDILDESETALSYKNCRKYNANKRLLKLSCKDGLVLGENKSKNTITAIEYEKLNIFNNFKEDESVNGIKFLVKPGIKVIKEVLLLTNKDVVNINSFYT